MTSSAIPGTPRVGQTDEAYESVGAEQIREQLSRILASPVFRNSKRYAAVLTYIIEQALAGNAEHLKERTIGVDVFGREPDYDTGSDHVVRSAMAEVRKRLAQYYQGETQAGELHVDLQPGSYVPQFRGERRVIHADPVPAEPISNAENRSENGSRLRWVAVISIVTIILAGAVSLRQLTLGHDWLKEFWRPVFASSKKTLLCIGNLEGGRLPTAKESTLDLRSLDLGDFHRLPTQTIHIADAIALAKFTGFLQAQGKPWRIAQQSEVTFGDLRDGPAILIGLLNNDWTERQMGKLRYRAEKVAPRKVVIRDARNPSKNDWMLDYATPLLEVNRDYALVLRFFDPNTGQPVITAAGISIFGTSAAAEFLTDPDEMNMLSSVAPGWEKKNLEIVLTTEVVRAKYGKPRILATHVW